MLDPILKRPKTSEAESTMLSGNIVIQRTPKTWALWKLPSSWNIELKLSLWSTADICFDHLRISLKRMDVYGEYVCLTVLKCCFPLTHPMGRCPVAVPDVHKKNQTNSKQEVPELKVPKGATRNKTKPCNSSTLILPKMVLLVCTCTTACWKTSYYLTVTNYTHYNLCCTQSPRPLATQCWRIAS